jgi:hypothetical protein
MDGAAGSVAITGPFGGPLRLPYISATFPDAHENRIVVEAGEKRRGNMRRTIGYEAG